MSLKWYFNASPKALGTQGTSYSIGFTSAGTHFTILRNGTVFKEKFYLYYNDTEAYKSGWKNSAYRTITFDTEPTGALLTYLEANATVVQEDPYKFKHYYRNNRLIGTGQYRFRPFTAAEPSPEPQVYTDCLTFTGKDSEFTLKATNKTWDGTLEWSTDHNNWTTLTGTEAMQSVNKKLYLRGKGNTYFYNSSKVSVKWQLSALAGCSGNIQTLLDWENPPTSIPSLRCYSNMFAGCINLTTAPELPATTLTLGCYTDLFYNCTNLTIAPELPATILANYCYYYMFEGCTNLTTAPELPANILAEGCYQRMFFKCTSLTSAPELPATTLAKSCYESMFRLCTNLKVNATSGHKIFTCPSNMLSDAVNNMFIGTGGSFTGTPTAGTTYYWTE